jgi:hypothetical protein
MKSNDLKTIQINIHWNEQLDVCSAIVSGVSALISKQRPQVHSSE